MTNNKKIAYTYMILHLAELYAMNKNRLKKYKNLSQVFSDFNLENDFTQLKCELFPFLVTIGNGKKFELAELFGYFTIHNGIGFKTNEKLEFEEDVLAFEGDKLKVIENKIYDTIESVNDIFKMLEINEGFNKYRIPACIDINTSINNIHKFKIPNFMNESLEDIKYWSKKNSTYEIYNQFFGIDGNVKEEYSQDAKYFMQELNISILTYNYNLQPKDSIQITPEILEKFRENFKFETV